jgi:prevent-host-death family protein
VTIHDYYQVMTTGIADLKARLSHYLRSVRRGEQVVVLDRDTPVAVIVPYSPSGRGLTIRQPRVGAPRPGAVTLPPPLGQTRDVVELLLADRQTDR